MAAKVSLKLDQVADVLKQLSMEELEELDSLLERGIAEEVDKRHAEMKTGKKIPLAKAKAFRDME